MRPVAVKRTAETVQIGHWIADAIEARSDESRLAAIGAEVRALCHRHPVYPETLLA